MVLGGSFDATDPNIDAGNKIYLARNGSGGDDIDKCILVPIFKFYRGSRKELKDLSPQMHWIKIWEKGADYVFGRDADGRAGK